MQKKYKVPVTLRVPVVVNVKGHITVEAKSKSHAMTKVGNFDADDLKAMTAMGRVETEEVTSSVARIPSEALAEAIRDGEINSASPQNRDEEAVEELE